MGFNEHNVVVNNIKLGAQKSREYSEIEVLTPLSLSITKDEHNIILRLVTL